LRGRGGRFGPPGRRRRLLSHQRPDRAVAVARGQAVALGIAGRVEVLRPFHVREALELLRTDRQQRQRILVAQALQGFDVRVALDGALLERNAARREQGARRAAGAAFVPAVEGDGIALRHLAQFIGQAGGVGAGRGRRALLAGRRRLGARARGAVGEGDLAVLVHLAVDGLRHRTRGNEHEGKAGQAMQW